MPPRWGKEQEEELVKVVHSLLPREKLPDGEVGLLLLWAVCDMNWTTVARALKHRRKPDAYKGRYQKVMKERQREEREAGIVDFRAGSDPDPDADPVPWTPEDDGVVRQAECGHWDKVRQQLCDLKRPRTTASIQQRFFHLRREAKRAAAPPEYFTGGELIKKEAVEENLRREQHEEARRRQAGREKSLVPSEPDFSDARILATRAEASNDPRAQPFASTSQQPLNGTTSSSAAPATSRAGPASVAPPAARRAIPTLARPAPTRKTAQSVEPGPTTRRTASTRVPAPEANPTTASSSLASDRKGKRRAGSPAEGDDATDLEAAATPAALRRKFARLAPTLSTSEREKIEKSLSRAEAEYRVALASMEGYAALARKEQQA
ncbi:hypothetical protein JCM10207_000071 [Rhodosporidiobolus poonsookiae]